MPDGHMIGITLHVKTDEPNPRNFRFGIRPEREKSGGVVGGKDECGRGYETSYIFISHKLQ